MTATLASDTFRQVRLITLGEGQNGESIIFRLEKGGYYRKYIFSLIINFILDHVYYVYFLYYILWTIALSNKTLLIFFDEQWIINDTILIVGLFWFVYILLGWLLHFVLGPTLAGKKVHIFTNHPTSSKEKPNRNNYR